MRSASVGRQSGRTVASGRRKLTKREVGQRKRRDREARAAATRTHKNIQVDKTGRTCTLCNEWKEWEHFHTNTKGANGYQARCKPCYKKLQTAYNRKNRKHVKRVRRNNMLKANYNMDHDEYDLLLAHNKGKCWICGGGSGMSLAVDHNHANNKNRGLLCKPCNRILGHWRDDPTKAARATRYLKDDGETVNKILEKK